MSSQTVAETQGSQDEEELEEEELGNLEEEVTQMAEKVAEYRATLPDQLKTTLASLLAAQRPALQMHFDVGSLPQPGSSNAPASVQAKGVKLVKLWQFALDCIVLVSERMAE
nr:Packaging protein [Ipomoea batatas]